MYFFQIRGQDALQAILRSDGRGRPEVLDYTRAQYDTGWARRSPWLRQRKTAWRMRRPAPPAWARHGHSYDMRLRCGGRRPLFGFRSGEGAGCGLRPPVPIGVPSQLLERRPDIAASERTMASAKRPDRCSRCGVLSDADTGLLRSPGELHLKHLSTPSRFWSEGPPFQTIYDGGTAARPTVNQSLRPYNGDVAATGRRC